MLSDGLNYSKIFTFCNGFVCFCLPDSEGMVSVKINENQMGLKRMEPYNDTDLVNLQDMLNNATKDIDPLNMKDQIVGTFN